MNVSKILKTAGLTIKKHSPEILMVVGGASLLGAVGTAIWKTATCETILDEHEERMNECKDKVERAKIKAEESNGEIIYTDEDAANDLKGYTIKNYAKTVGKMAWHYLPTIGLTIASGASFLGAFCIIKGRYSAMASAFAVTASAFEAYRKRVIEEEGEERDLYYRYGVKKEKVSVIDPETGKTTKEKEEVNVTEEDVKGDGLFTFVFDERSGEYYKDMSSNLINLNGIIATFNIDTQAEGYVLNRDIFKRLDVWDSLTPKQKKESIKWGYADGDLVDFGIYSARNRDAITNKGDRRSDQLILELRGCRPIYDFVV